MLFRRLVCSCPQFARVLFARVHKISHISIKQISTRPRTVASTLTFTTYLATFLSPGVLCEEEEEQEKKMSEIEKADTLYDEGKQKELLEYLVQFKDSEDPELLWRVVRAHRDRSNMSEVGKDEKKKLAFDALEISKRALQFGAEVGACHKWYGIMLSVTGDHLGTKAKLENSPAMKEHFAKAVELNPEDATSHYLIGMWCFSFADLAWYERKIATVVFGTPPTSTYEEALGHFEHSEKVRPLNYSGNLFQLGLTNIRLNNKAKAKEWFQQLSAFPSKNEEDKEFVKKAQDHLKSL